MSTTTPESLRAEAAQHDQNAADSFDRCDTDGFLSQWASGINAQKARLAATLLERGNRATFYRYELTDLEGTHVDAKLIDGRYGKCWALLDEAGSFTGTFVSAHPAREATIERKGYREVRRYFTVSAHVILKGTNSTNVTAIVVPDNRELVWHGRQPF